jgi:hypothetical protein
VVFWCIVAMLGVHYLWQKRKKFKVILFIVALLAVIEPINFMYNYFVVNRDYAAREMDHAFVASLETARNNLKDNETLYISRSIFCPYRIQENFKPFAYSTILFALRISPQEYIKYGRIHPERVRLWKKINARKGLLLISNKVTVNKDGKVIWVNNPEPLPAGSVLIKTFKPDTTRLFCLFRIKPIKRIP